ncbi:MAG: ABC transporter substrate-binding protein, partial [Halalkalicoccus sp.]|nr:ABC transporter substrate-binding protein [Halalkalicoccus sp.]
AGLSALRPRGHPDESGLTRAACREFHGFDPDEEATPVEVGSKVGLTEALQNGEVDGVFQFWPIVPEITETGPFREAFPVSELVQRLSGTDNRLPVSTFLTSEEYFEDNPQAIRGFKRAYGEAVDQLTSNDEIWTTIGEELMYENDPEVIRAVRDGWRDMVVADWNEETIEGMDRLFDHLLEVAGEEAIGVDHLPDGLFRLEVPE